MNKTEIRTMNGGMVTHGTRKEGCHSKTLFSVGYEFGNSGQIL